jgi:hypothetical protein
VISAGVAQDRHQRAWIGDHRERRAPPVAPRHRGEIGHAPLSARAIGEQVRRGRNARAQHTFDHRARHAQLRGRRIGGMFDQGQRLDAGEIAGQSAAHLVDVAGGVVVHLRQRADEILVAGDVAFHRLGDGGGGELEPVARLALKARDRLADAERCGDGDREKDDQHERGRMGPDADELLDLMHRRPWGGVSKASLSPPAS